MRNLAMIVLLVASLATGCTRKSTNPQSGFTAGVHIVTPFAGDLRGKLYLKQGHLRVDLGPMTDVYEVRQKQGWRMLTDSKQYMSIGWKDVSTYLPPMTNESPCPNSEQPSACKIVGGEVVDGRPATKWEALNQHGQQVHFWTDDQLGIAERCQNENVTYEATDIRPADVADRLFELPSSYTRIAQRSGATLESIR